MDYEKHKTKLLYPFLVLVSICTLKGGIAEVIRCKETERKALLKFKKGLVEEYDVLSSWRRSECCKWRGVGCSNKTGHVISLHLNEETLDQWNALRGNLSNNLVDLRHLISLDLSSSDFSGNEIPEFVGSLDKLRYLNLSSCSLVGKVPSQLGNLTSLRTLDLGHNNGLEFPDLDWLSNLSSLSLVDFSGSSFAANLKTILFQKILIITSLKNLYLGGCEFSNDKSLEDEYVNSTFASLSVLDLSSSSLASSNFHWLFNVTTSDLVSMDLSLNALDGPIPDEFGQKLVSLDLSNNRFEGPIPKSLWNLKGLKRLDLSWNNLTGPLADFERTMVSLEILKLSYNRITGSVPESFWRASRLEILRASFNSLQGVISESHIQLENLQQIVLPTPMKFPDNWLFERSSKLRKIASLNYYPTDTVLLATRWMVGRDICNPPLSAKKIAALPMNIKGFWTSNRGWWVKLSDDFDYKEIAKHYKFTPISFSARSIDEAVKKDYKGLQFLSGFSCRRFLLELPYFINPREAAGLRVPVQLIE
ncbi:hypothetical protein F511_35343 [Dorcoceras hygrometricum]|uniref:Uncharacterized protein n=1 Tax=Dorcoceras hygrometricum TaxID=472368 RepID=A0A2Z7CUQ7_9LAMI|nr:hypothetical protein F511_35343 [Dorcoceras hygrometricum]